MFIVISIDVSNLFLLNNLCVGSMVFILQMAPHKASRDSKKQKFTQGSSSRAPPIDFMDEDAEFEYDQHKFTSEAATRRFLEIMPFGILLERHINMKVGEFDDFRLELERRQWHRVLGNLPNEVDDVLVKEFFEYAYNFDGSLARQAKVQGKIIKFDHKALNTFLRTLVFPTDRNTPYGNFLNEEKDFEAIATRLCLLGESYVIGVSDTHVRVLCKHLNSLAQMWSVLSLRVMLPSSGFQHSSRPYARQKVLFQTRQYCFVSNPLSIVGSSLNIV